MDIEKAIQFLTENAAAHDARLLAIETNLLAIETNLLAVTTIVKTLAETAVAHQKEIEEMRKEQRQRDADLDERIAKLVSAIGALASQRPQGPPAQ